MHNSRDQMIQRIKDFQDYLLAKDMKSTLQIFRQELMEQIPAGPSQQFINELESVKIKNNLTSTIVKKKSNHTSLTTLTQQSKKPNKKQNIQPQLQVQGILGKISYSDKLLSDDYLNQKIYRLMDKQFFKKAHQKLFPDSLIKKNLPKIYSSNYNSNHSYNSNKNHKIIQSQQTQIFNIQKHQIQKSDSHNFIPFQSQSNKQEFSSNLQYFQCDIDPFMNKKGAIIDKQQSIRDGSDQSKLISQPSIIDQLITQQYAQDQYVNDNDLGYIQLCFTQNEVLDECTKITKKYGYPERALKMNSKIQLKHKYSYNNLTTFPDNVNFAQQMDDFYPVQYDGTIYDLLTIPVIFEREKTGLEDKKHLKLSENSIVAGKYKIIKKLGNGVFAKAYMAYDLINQKQICLKMIINNKDYFDQALDQIKFLRYININFNPEKTHILKLNRVFYTQQHLFFETQLLQDNLYVAYKKNPSFFSLSIIRQIAKQTLIALNSIHYLNLIHADLKPENILIHSYSPISIKLIDFGNSFYSHNKFTDYVQSRSYRAPQVLLGLDFNQKIDIWSLGCILSELWTKHLLFPNLHVPGLIAKIQSIVGPWPQWMLQDGKNVQQYFSSQNLIFFQQDEKYHILIPKITSLKARVRTDDINFLNFLEKLLQIDPKQRISAAQALTHKFLN